MLKIALTGGIGSGKTTVAKRFTAHGVPVIDADQISRELVQPGQQAYKTIIEEFGADVLNEQNEINRAYLRKLIFSDLRARVKLESILHPLIRQKISSQLQALNEPYCIIAIPLLIETGQADMADRILVIDTPRELQISRTMQRDNLSAEGVEAIINSQVDRQTRCSLADDILDNSGSLEGLIQQVDELHAKYSQNVKTETLVEPLKFADNDSINNDNNSEMISNMSCLKSVESLGDVAERIDTASEEFVYELPLNEKIRTLIRLESLFTELEHHLSGNTVWDSRSAVNTFVAIVNIFGRPEIKTDLLKEMDRINSILNKYASLAGVNAAKLKNVQDELSQTAKQLRNLEGQLGQGLKQNEFVMSIRQRDSIPGGALDMDIPAYGHWLSKNIESRSQDIRSWMSEFEIPKKAILLILRLIRDSGISSDATTKNGFYQHSLDSGMVNQIVRVVLPKGSYFFPEISGGRHRFTVRFLKPNGFDRPVQIDQDMPFKLICCTL